MSRAFVTETENHATGLPDRPISADRNFVTEAGLADIEAALNLGGPVIATEQAADLVELPFQAFRRPNAEQRQRLQARIDRTSKHGMARAMQGEV
jgi:hypothetical protein